MIYSLVICTIVYVLLTLVLTGAVNFRKFDGVGDPLAFIFETNNLNVPWMQFFVSIAAVVAMTSVLLVFQMGQPRIWMSMSRDGLLPSAFKKIHPKYKTPSFSTIVTGLVVGIPILFTDKTFVLDFTSIATLFAFVLVCGGVLLIPRKEKVEGKFTIPYINGKFIFPLMILLLLGILFNVDHNYLSNQINFLNDSQDIQTVKVSTLIFWILMLLLSILTLLKNYSLIPLLGVATCLYLLTGMTLNNWLWFGSWLLLGLVIYFLYGYHKSKLALQQ